jgi:predicted thioesterase
MTSSVEPYEESHVVAATDTAQAFGPEFPAAASTPYVLGLAEVAAHRSIADSIPTGQTTVGTRSVVEHLAPSPVGAELLVKSRLVGRDGRKLKFGVEVYDSEDLVATVEHHRVIVDLSRIQARLVPRTE